LKIVLFTNRCSTGYEILKGIADKGLCIQSIIIEVQGKEKILTRVSNSIKSRGLIETLTIAASEFIMNLVDIIGLSSIQRCEWHNIESYKKFSNEVYIVNNFNSPGCEDLLKRLSPDIIVLGGSRILKKYIINIPRIGILNAHPGILPKYRGVDVIPWAVYNGDDVGVTVHLIDENVDSGLIIDRQIICIKNGDTLESLRKRAELLSGKMIADALIELDNGRRFDHATEENGQGQVYHRMSRSLLKEARKRLRETATCKK
jgi:folate-dependent phosphoribosylglycinamide formyltransferase PurN